MSKENMQVMQTLIRQCKQAFQAKKPLILIDTEDIDLMDRLARESKLVDFYESAEKAYLIGQTEERKYVKYRKYIDYQDAVLDRTPNFTYQAKELKEIATKGGGPSYGEGSMMAVVHLTQQDRDTIECLRAYVHSYVHCMDNASALRTSCVLLYGDPGILPSDLLRYTEILTVNYPSIAEIKEILIEAVKEKKDCPPLEDSLTDELSNLMVGFSLPRAEEYIHRLLWIDGEDGRPMLFSKKRKNILLDAKAQAIRSSGGLLTLYREKDEDTALENQKQKMDDNDTLCGMGAYKEWAAKAGKHMNANNDYALQ